MAASRLRAITLTGLIGLSGPLMAGEQDNLFESARSLGRGRTQVAAYDSDDATRFNPATLAEPKLTFQLRPAQLDLFVGENSLKTISDLMKISETDDSLDFLRKFEDKFGKRQYGRGQFGLLGMRFGAFELSFFGVSSNWLELRRPTTPYMNWQVDLFAGSNISYAFKMGKNFSFGTTIRPLYRFNFQGDLTFTDILEFLPPSEAEFEDYAKQKTGMGYGVDLGGIWAPSASFRLGLTIQNVGDTSFEAVDDNGPPPALRQKVNTGMLYRKKLGTWNWDWSLDIQDMINRDGINLLRLVHGGMELGKSFVSRDNDIGLLAGVNEGYLTGGAFLDLYVLRFEVVNYAVESGLSPGQRMDRRWGMSMQSAMTF